MSAGVTEKETHRGKKRVELLEWRASCSQDVARENSLPRDGGAGATLSPKTASREIKSAEEAVLLHVVTPFPPQRHLQDCIF